MKLQIIKFCDILGLRNMLKPKHTILSSCKHSIFNRLWSHSGHLGINQGLFKVSMYAEFIHIGLDEKDRQ